MAKILKIKSLGKKIDLEETTVTLTTEKGFLSCIGQSRSRRWEAHPN